MKEICIFVVSPLVVIETGVVLLTEEQEGLQLKVSRKHVLNFFVPGFKELFVFAQFHGVNTILPDTNNQYSMRIMRYHVNKWTDKLKLQSCDRRMELLIGVIVWNTPFSWSYLKLFSNT